MKLIRLDQLLKGQSCVLRSYDESLSSANPSMASQLQEMGLIEGSIIEVKHEAPFGGDPFAVMVRGALVALGRNESKMILVEVL